LLVLPKFSPPTGTSLPALIFAGEKPRTHQLHDGGDEVLREFFGCFVFCGDGGEAVSVKSW